jgi:hypothetical protein
MNKIPVVDRNSQRFFVLVLATCIVLAATAQPLGTIARQSDGLPSGIGEGTCDNHGAFVFELAPVGTATVLAGTEVAASDPVGAGSAVPVLFSETTVEAALTDLVEEGHAIVVAAGDAAADEVACGDIGGRMTLQMAGMVMPGDELMIGLRERNGSGFSGIAILVAEGLTTTVRIYLAEDLSGDATPGTPADTTPAPANAAATRAARSRNSRGHAGS